MLTVTHEAAAGTLIEGTAKGDGTAAVLKARGWRWGRSIGCWYVPMSRDRAPKMAIIEATAAALRQAGHTVDVVVSEQLRAPAEIEADKIARQQDRAAALAEKADRQHTAAAAATDRARNLADRVPFGQPILVGHHSEGRARRDAVRIHAAARKEADARSEAQEADRRAAAAAATTEARYAPVTVANRIQRLNAELRRWERARDGHSRTLFTTADGTKHTEDTPAAEGQYRERALREITRLGEEIAYWEQVRATQAAQGVVRVYDRTTIAKGDAVKCGGIWREVVRVNAKSVSVRTGYSWTDRIDYHRIQGHRSATEAP